MKKILLTLVLVLLVHLVGGISPVRAIIDPFSVPNNRIGVHILSPDEVGSAAKLVNSSGGDWGYVTIPMRSDDRDPDKWIKFFTECRNKHIIPIVRLATFPSGGTWAAPTSFDLVDFANFLNEMPWPTKNRYIILFNEPNHSNEWGGQVDPVGYATLISEAKSLFKSRSEDFFLLSGGLDMSVPNSATSMEALRFYSEMSKSVPGWYDALDGLAVHSYPNPGFSASVFSKSRYGITSYKYELNYLSSLGYEEKPVFITETGTVIARDFYKPALTQVWTDPNIVAITPFLLFAGTGDFVRFSLLDLTHQPKESYQDIYSIPKISGSPLLANVTISAATSMSTSSVPYTPPVKLILDRLKKLFSTGEASSISIGETTVVVELADTPQKRERGLSGRNSLAPNTGMLFTFPKAEKQTFWMKDMRFALDFIWIHDHQVVGINENVLPPSQTNSRPVIVPSNVPIDMVLEVPAGFVGEHGIKNGDRVEFMAVVN